MYSKKQLCDLTDALVCTHTIENRLRGQNSLGDEYMDACYASMLNAAYRTDDWVKVLTNSWYMKQLLWNIVFLQPECH